MVKRDWGCPLATTRIIGRESRFERSSRKPDQSELTRQENILCRDRRKEENILDACIINVDKHMMMINEKVYEKISRLSKENG